MLYPRNIEDTKEMLVRQVREYVIQQKEEWQKVPYLALRAEGRAGFSKLSVWSYKYGLWVLLSTTNPGCTWVCVDCGTGQLCTLPSGSKLEEACDNLVLDLAKRPDELNATQVLLGLRTTIKSFKSAYHTEEEEKKNEVWRRETQKKFGVKKVFKRNASSPLQYA